jgi:hypothetical protein
MRPNRLRQRHFACRVADNSIGSLPTMVGHCNGRPEVATSAFDAVPLKQKQRVSDGVHVLLHKGQPVCHVRSKVPEYQP